MSRAGTLSRIMFSWVRPLLALGIERQLNIDDLFPVCYRWCLYQRAYAVRAGVGAAFVKCHWATGIVLHPTLSFGPALPRRWPILHSICILSRLVLHARSSPQLPKDCAVENLADNFHSALGRAMERDRAERRDRGLAPLWCALRLAFPLPLSQFPLRPPQRKQTTCGPTVFFREEDKQKKGFSLPSLPVFPPVFNALRECIGAEFMRAGAYKALNDCLQFLPAVVLSNLLQAVSARSPSRSAGGAPRFAHSRARRGRGHLAALKCP